VMSVGLALGALVVLAFAYAIAAPTMRVAAIRAERRGDEDRGQQLRVVSFRMRMTMIALVLVAAVVLLVLAIA
jgi:uncharacterized membrane protein